MITDLIMSIMFFAFVGVVTITVLIANAFGRLIEEKIKNRD